MNILIQLIGIKKKASVYCDNLAQKDDEDTRRDIDATSLDNLESETLPTEESKSFNPHKFRKLHPILHWEKVDHLTYTEKLDLHKHYKAHCNDYRGRLVNGDYFYDPKPGTILKPGIRELTITFVPHNSYKYQSFSHSRIIEVKKKRPKVEWNYHGGYVTYRKSLPVDIFDSVSCELKEGSFVFSHEKDCCLEVGIHTLNVEYDPSPKEAEYFGRGYAKLTIQVIGTVVPITWTLPVDFTGPSPDFTGKRRKSDIGRIGMEIIYLDKIPDWIFCAKPIYDDAEGEIVYDPPKNFQYEAGYHTIKATFVPTDSRRFFPSSIEQTIYIHHCMTELIWNQPFSIYDGEELDDFILNCTTVGNISGIFTYDPPFGSSLPMGEHTLSVHFEPTNKNFLPADKSVQIKVLPKRQLKIFWLEPQDILYPCPLDSIQLNASLTGFGSTTEGEFVYDPPAGTILDTGDHLLTVTFIPKKASFSNCVKSVPIKVHQAQAKIIWSTPDNIMEGEGIFDNVLNCYSTNVSDGEFIYNPPKGTIFEGGKHLLTVKFIPKDLLNYKEVSTNVYLQVNERPRMNPRLKWTDPVTNDYIVYGMPLNEDMLDAKCTNADGYFDYDPPLKTILPAGRHILTAIFKPENSQKCHTGKITSTITIHKGKPNLVWDPKSTKLTYGDILTSELHLNAYSTLSSNDPQRIPGKCIYQPPLGTLFEAGDRTVICKFIPDDLVNYNEVSISRDFYVHRAIPELVWDPPLGKLYYPTYIYSVLPKPRCLNPSIEGKFEFDFDYETCLIVGEHQLSCHFYPTDIMNYLGASASISVKILKTLPVINWEPKTPFMYEAPLNSLDHCNATCNLPGGQYIYDPPVGTILPVGEKITLSFKYIPDDIENYESISTIRTIEVMRRSPVIQWEVPWKVPYGTFLTSELLDAKLSTKENSPLALQLLENGRFEYSPPLKTLLSAGSVVDLTVTFYPPQSAERNYFSTQKIVTLEVYRIAPQIVWKPKLATLMEGAPLTDNQLNAYIVQKNIFPGTLEYSHELGTCLSKGRHKIEVVYIPENPNNVLPFSMSLFFEVIKKAPKIVWETDPITGQMKCIKEFEK